MWLRWLLMRLLRFLGVVMSEHCRTLLILINTLERLLFDYHVVNSNDPSYTYTTIRVGDHPYANYFIVSDKGLSYLVSPLNFPSMDFKIETIASTVMAAADV